jgi:putative iron-dependent peroxidase
MNNQAGILADVPRNARQLVFDLQPEVDIAEAISALAGLDMNENIIVGLGASLVKMTGKEVDGLDSFPVLNGPGFDIPSTPHALWIFLRGDDGGELYHRGAAITEQLEYDFSLVEVLDCFMYKDSRDLSGYIDGTENPKGDEAVNAAIVQNSSAAMDGSSFVAVQQWVHDLEHFKHLEVNEQDNVFGRHISNNEEFDEAPEAAHVKRTAQESYEPEAFILRRSIPWVEGNDAGLNFIAYGKSFDAFEMILNRMVGNEDGIVDNLFRFTRPITGAYYWCPPVKDGQMNLAAISG